MTMIYIIIFCIVASIPISVLCYLLIEIYKMKKEE